MSLSPQNPRLSKNEISPNQDLIEIFDASAGQMKLITPSALGGGSPAGTAGQIQFTDGSAFAADSNLYWDNTNKRLGVGETTPTARVQIKGEGATSSTIALLVQDSAASELFKVSDSGYTYFTKANWYTHTTGPSMFRSTTGAGFRFYTGGDAMEIQSTGVGIGTNSPTARLHIKGSGSTSATTALLVQNSSGTDALKVTDDREVTIESNLKLKSILARNSQDSGRIYLQTWGNGYLNVTNDGVAVSIGSLLAPNSSAIIDATSTTKGFLPPRGSNAQMLAIVSPAEGLVFYDNTNHKLNVFDGTSWVAMH